MGRTTVPSTIFDDSLICKDNIILSKKCVCVCVCVCGGGGGGVHFAFPVIPVGKILVLCESKLRCRTGAYSDTCLRLMQGCSKFLCMLTFPIQNQSDMKFIGIQKPYSTYNVKTCGCCRHTGDFLT